MERKLVYVPADFYSHALVGRDGYRGGIAWAARFLLTRPRGA